MLTAAPASPPIDASDDDRPAIEATLARFGPGATAFAARAGTTIVALASGERYCTRSPALRRLGVDVDRWPVAPAGLFVVEERTVYLRSASPMTVAHEFGHALDCALGGGTYRSAADPAVRAAFGAARAFVTPYAATGLDEYVAEVFRAYVEVNDARSPWPRATRRRLRDVDPAIADWCDERFADGFASARARCDAYAGTSSTARGSAIGDPPLRMLESAG